MHDGMPYDPIQGQGQGHWASEIPKIALFSLSPLPLNRGSWQMTTNSLARAQYLNLIGPDF